jgi:hypothetical protein
VTVELSPPAPLVVSTTSASAEWRLRVRTALVIGCGSSERRSRNRRPHPCVRCSVGVAWIVLAMSETSRLDASGRCVACGRREQRRRCDERVYVWLVRVAAATLTVADLVCPTFADAPLTAACTWLRWTGCARSLLSTAALFACSGVRENARDERAWLLAEAPSHTLRYAHLSPVL